MNIRPVSHNLYRGSHPIDIPDLRTLSALGVTTIISLETSWHKLFGWKGESRWWTHTVCGSNKFINFPLSTFFPPSKESTKEIIDSIVMAQIGGGVYLHCYSGVDRTGWICAAYRVLVAGWTVGDAWSEAVKEGMHWRYFWWKPFFLKLWR